MKLRPFCCNYYPICVYSNSDFISFFLRYKSEVVTSKKYIQAFCLRNKVP